jgi:hypothetical protein
MYRGINNLKLFLNLFTIYYQAVRAGGGERAYPNIHHVQSKT